MARPRGHRRPGSYSPHSVPTIPADVDLTGSLALVMGAEGQGLRRLTVECCDQLVHLPMAGKVESLNVSVTADVYLFEAVRQRPIANPN